MKITYQEGLKALEAVRDSYKPPYTQEKTEDWGSSYYCALCIATEDVCSNCPLSAAYPDEGSGELCLDIPNAPRVPDLDKMSILTAEQAARERRKFYNEVIIPAYKKLDPRDDFFKQEEK